MRRRPRPRRAGCRAGAARCSSGARTGLRSGRADRPKHIRERLTDLGARHNGLREYGVGVGNIESEYDRRAADRRRREHAHLGELVSDVQHSAANPQLNRHQPPVRRRDPINLLGAERLAVEGSSALGALNNDMRSNCIETVGPPDPETLERSCRLYARCVPIEQLFSGMWRPANEDRVLLMAGQTTGYTMEPRGEYVFGIVEGKPMRSRRGREHRLVLPGRPLFGISSNAHTGAAMNDQPWTSRLMVVEVAHSSTPSPTTKRVIS